MTEARVDRHQCLLRESSCVGEIDPNHINPRKISPKILETMIQVKMYEEKVKGMMAAERNYKREYGEKVLEDRKK